MPNKGIYKVQFSKRYVKDLEKIPKKDQKNIQESISSLTNNPRPNGCKKLKGSKEQLYRIRCGDYRVVYTIRDDVLLVLIIEIGHRKDMYWSI